MPTPTQNTGAYQLRVVLRGVNPLIWRRILTLSDTTIAELHDILQIVIGWEDVHLHRFHIRGRDYGVYRDGGIWFRDDADSVRLADLGLRLKERFLYEYDFGDLWQHEIRLEAVLPIASDKCYPQCVGGKRAAPPEDCGGCGAYMAIQGELSFDGDPEELDDIYDEDENPVRLYPRSNPERFDRRRVNAELRQWVSAKPRRVRQGGDQ